MKNGKKGLSRREFLKATATSAAALATGVSAASAAPSRQPRARQGEVVIQFGLYGFWEIPAEGGPETPGQQAMQAFLDAHPNVRLEQIDFNIWDAGTLLTGIAGGTAPAYYMSGVISGWTTAGTLSSFKQGLFADITPHYQQYAIDSQLGEFATSVNRAKYETPEGEFYGVPFEVAIGNGIAFRKDLVEAAGFSPTVEWTWEDVRQIAAALTGEFVKGIAMQPWGIDWALNAEGVGYSHLFSHVPAPDTGWNWRRDYESRMDTIVTTVERFRAMMYEDESILTDVTSNDSVANDSLYNRTAAMATIPGQFLTRTGIPWPMAIAEEEGVPFDQIIGYLPHPRGLNGHFGQFPSIQPISFSPDLSAEQLDVLVQMFAFLELGEGFDLRRRTAFEETGNLQQAFSSWPFVRATQSIEGVEGTPRDAWGALVDTVEYMAGIAGQPEAGAFIPAEANQGPTDDAWSDVQSRLTFESGSVDIAGIVKEAQDVWNTQAADFESSVPDDVFVQGAAEYYAALASFWEEKFPGFYEGTFKEWYETVVAGALGM
jgi:ABC-type glycerol-3-phosphate transport system substrate-binding protein